jgi:hypothetical protein
VILVAASFFDARVDGREVHVGDDAGLHATVTALEPGTTLVIASGEYSGGLYLRDVHGRADAPVVIRGADPNDPPVFREGTQAIHLADCSYVTLRHLVVDGFPRNGINIDDGGSYVTPAHHILVEDVTIGNTGPEGNHDALKMSGVDHFTVRACRFEGWGGSGIDMVGCHDGVIEECTFVGLDGFSQSNAVQLKGGTEDVLVHCCLFQNAGRRSINLGGSTGLRFFRPDVRHYEARRITIAGNTFIGSTAPVAWVTADGGRVHHNTVFMPQKWVLRILQETSDPNFTPCQNGVFENNLIVYDTRVDVLVNVGPRTTPETFAFRRNVWCDVSGEGRPALPTTEVTGTYLDATGMDIATLIDACFAATDAIDERAGAHAYRRR